jgi:serine phosphatase RsbU (regulator of sigma subunit)
VAGIVPAAIGVMALLILLILVVAGLVNARIAADSTRTYRALRQATISQNAVERLQLDEESGLRGYVATGDKILLAPYRSAHAHMASSLNALSNEVATFHEPLLEARAERLAALNMLWEQTVAAPSLTARHPTRTAKLQIRANAIIDAFRRESELLRSELDARSDSLLDQLFAKLRVISWISLALVMLVTLSVIGWLRYQNRLRERYETTERQIESLQRIADAFHRAQLPQALPSSPYVSFDATYIPAEEVAVVGGDWYDVFTLDDRRYVFSMGDVTGHGLEAAIVMSRVRQTIFTLASIESNPAVILEQANDVLRTQDDHIVTALCGTIDAQSGVVTFASAGHPPALIVAPSGKIRELSSSAPPLGATDRLQVGCRDDHLFPGEMLVCYTDGIIENERDIIEGEARLRRVLSTLRPSERREPAPAIRQRMLGTRRGRDDVAILTIRRSPLQAAQDTSAA